MGPTCLKQAPTGPNRPNIVESGPIWSQTVKKKNANNCSKWSNMVKVGLKWYKMIQNGQNCPICYNIIKYGLQ